MSEALNPPAGEDYEWVNAWVAGKPQAAPHPAEPPAFRPTSVPPENASRGVRVVARDLIGVPSDAAASSTIVLPPSTPPVDGIVPKAEAPAPLRVVEVLERAELPPSRTAPEFLVHPATRRFFAGIRLPAAIAEPITASEEVIVGAPVKVADATAEVTPIVSAEAEAEVTPVAPVFTLPQVEAVMPAAAAMPAEADLSAAVLPPRGPVTLSPAEQLERDIAEIIIARDALFTPQFPPTRRRARGPFAALRNAESVPILVGSVLGATLLIVFGAAASLIRLR